MSYNGNPGSFCFQHLAPLLHVEMQDLQVQQEKLQRLIRRKEREIQDLRGTESAMAEYLADLTKRRSPGRQDTQL
jgi:hypothetical protein